MSAKKILIVDDETTIVSLMSARLKASGFEVCTARDGWEAVEKVKTEKPHLIIMDVLMPRLTGYEAMRKIRDNPESRKTPALIIFARGTMKDYFSDITNVEFIPKPYDIKTVIERIEFLLGTKNVVETTDQRRVILLGVEDFLVAKISTLLTSLKCEVLTALNEEDACAMARKAIAKNQAPSFILCQYWEEDSVLDAPKLFRRLAGSLAHVPLYVYAKEALAVEAMKTFKGDRLITYNATSDLLKTLETFIKTNAPK